MLYKMKIVLGVLWIAQRWKDENGKKKLKVCSVLPLWFVPVFLAVDNEWIVYCLTCFYTSVSVF